MPESCDTDYRGWFELLYRTGGQDIVSADQVNMVHYAAVGGRIPIREMLGNYDIVAMAHDGAIPGLPRQPGRWDIVRCEILEPRLTLNFLLVDLEKDRCLIRSNKPGAPVKVQHRPNYPFALFKLPSPKQRRSGRSKPA